MIEKDQVRKIAVFRALFLGDMLCIIPTVRALRNQFPDARIFLIGLAWEVDLVQRYDQYFDAFVEFPGWPGLPEKVPDIRLIPEFISSMQREQFDLVLQMQGNGDLTNTMCLLWDARVTCGLRRADGICAEERLFPVSTDNDHEVLKFQKLLQALDIPPQGSDLEFPLNDEDVSRFEKVKDQLTGVSPRYVCIHPGSRNPTRRWSVGNFAIIGDKLASLGYTVVLTGSESEKELLSAVSERMVYTPIDATALYDSIKLGDLAALIRYSSLLVSNDTGVSHLAAALKTPSVIIFSPYSRISRWAPEDSTRHRIIPSQFSHDVGYVWKNVLDQLRFSQETVETFQSGTIP